MQSVQERPSTHDMWPRPNVKGVSLCENMRKKETWVIQDREDWHLVNKVNKGMGGD